MSVNHPDTNRHQLGPWFHGVFLWADTSMRRKRQTLPARRRTQRGLLAAHGFPNARFIVNGFQGAAIKEGAQAGLRLQSGWQNSGLPWSMKMNPAKMYRVDQP